MSGTILVGDCMEHLRTLPDCSVQCCVTSPPYWGLRNYGVDGQLGLEPTPETYVARMVEVFREVRRVLRDDGTLWLNVGDSFASGADGFRPGAGRADGIVDQRGQRNRNGTPTPPGLKPKDLVGIPWRLAFALQQDGWYLRSDIVWAKGCSFGPYVGNPMPESVTDRPTKSHEMVFLLSKSQRYYWDQLSVVERVGKSAVVQGPHLDCDALVLREDLGLQPTSPQWPLVPVPSTHDHRLIVQYCVGHASTILDCSERKHEFSLPALDTQEWQQVNEHFRSLLVVNVPVLRVATSLASSFGDGDISAKRFLQELYRLWITLPDGDNLKEAWRAAFPLCAVPVVNTNGNGPIRVNDACEIGKINVAHDSTSIPKHTTLCVSQSSGRNIRDVWTIPTEPCSAAHFAVMPTALVEPCIKAGTSERGCCPRCGAPWKRVVEKGEPDKQTTRGQQSWTAETGQRDNSGGLPMMTTTLGWVPTCKCDAGDPQPCVVLDPFFGAGTVGLVAERLGRSYIGIELNPEYAEIARRRIATNGKAQVVAPDPEEQGRLFAAEEGAA